MEWGEWRVSSVKKTHRHTHTSREVCFACRRCDLALLLLLTVLTLSGAHNESPVWGVQGALLPKTPSDLQHQVSPLESTQGARQQDVLYRGRGVWRPRRDKPTTPVWEPQSVGAGRTGRVGRSQSAASSKGA